MKVCAIVYYYMQVTIHDHYSDATSKAQVADAAVLQFDRSCCKLRINLDVMIQQFSFICSK